MFMFWFSCPLPSTFFAKYAIKSNTHSQSTLVGRTQREKERLKERRKPVATELEIKYLVYAWSVNSLEPFSFGLLFSPFIHSLYFSSDHWRGHHSRFSRLTVTILHDDFILLIRYFSRSVWPNRFGLNFIGFFFYFFFIKVSFYCLCLY